VVLGIGTGAPIGIAGGIFHMLNNAIYKCGLFLSGGSVQHRTNTTDLDKLGGLMRFMPLTFLGALVAALSISGVPPFNGFVSKWMIYQGIIELNGTGSGAWVIWLAAAMIGSALTLASFLKLLHATFLGVAAEQTRVKEVSWAMWLPGIILALVCILFGIFARRLPLKYFILPSVTGVKFSGIWTSSLATLLLIAGLALGGIIYLAAGNLKRIIREDEHYTGGEVIPTTAKVSGVDFYNTIKDIPTFNYIYRQAEAKVYDIYEQGKRFVFFLTRRFQRLHNGVLPTYLVWCLLGMILLFVLFFSQAFKI
jgi:NADH:ubiquinone oxidoreductase subunit 5 (subunit L)/multisubunit Na+/H+ antiporter MnhA subunit